MICRLIDFALVVLYLLIFKVCGINEISKIELFIFSAQVKKVNKFRKKKYYL